MGKVKEAYYHNQEIISTLESIKHLLQSIEHLVPSNEQKKFTTCLHNIEKLTQIFTDTFISSHAQEWQDMIEELYNSLLDINTYSLPVKKVINKIDFITKQLTPYLFTTSDKFKQIKEELLRLSEERFEKTLQNNQSGVIKAYNNSIEKLANTISDNKLKIEELNNTFNKVKHQSEEFSNLLNNVNFTLQNNRLSQKFEDTSTHLKKERNIFLTIGILITITLGIIYIYFFYDQYISKNIDYINHAMLITACSPFIFLAIWTFVQYGRKVHLIELYTYKANLAFTLKTAIEYVENIEGDNNKTTTLSTLHELLFRLYETPIHPQTPKKGITSKSITEITNLLKETKELVESIKPISTK